MPGWRRRRRVVEHGSSSGLRAGLRMRWGQDGDVQTLRSGEVFLDRTVTMDVNEARIEVRSEKLGKSKGEAGGPPGSRGSALSWTDTNGATRSSSSSMPSLHSQRRAAPISLRICRIVQKLLPIRIAATRARRSPRIRRISSGRGSRSRRCERRGACWRTPSARGQGPPGWRRGVR